VLRIALATRQRLINEHNERAWHAWHVAALPMQKRLPRLDTLLITRRSNATQSWRDQMMICRAIAAAHGSKRKNG
jgi:hypothetical protein